MKTISIASKNPVKIQATLNGFKRIFPSEEFRALSISVPSGVREQPMSDEEALQGALNRARSVAEQSSEADFSVGIEGGVEERESELAAFAWIVIVSDEMIGKGRTGTFFLPQDIARLVRQGKELGEADDIVFQKDNSKQENGAVGLLTGNVIDRALLYEHAVILALIPFINPHLYSK